MPPLKPSTYKIRLVHLRPLIDQVLNEGIDNHYHTFKVPKRGGKGYRTICAPSDTLKYIQRDILSQLKSAEHLYRNNAATGFNPGTSIKMNALRQCGHNVPVGSELLNLKFVARNMNLCYHYTPTEGEDFRNKNATVKMDLANAFDSIGVSLLQSQWPEAIALSEEDKEVLLKICTLNGTLPQGAPTSPILLNIALRKFDRECMRHIHFLHMNKGYVQRPTYTRYADDISISFRRDLFKPYWLIAIVKKTCVKFGLKLKDSKTRYMTAKHGRFVTGINIVNWDHLSVPRKVRSKIRAAIHQAANEIDPDKKAKLIQSIYGRIMHVYSIDITHGVRLFEYAIENKLIDSDLTIAGQKYKNVHRLVEQEIHRRIL